MTSPTQQTVDYRDPSPVGEQPERVRVALVAGSGPATDVELYRLLRRRLLTFSSIAAGGLLVASGTNVVIPLVIPPPPDHPLHGLTAAELAWRSWPSFLTMTVAVIAVVLLWRRPPRTVPGLRLVEFVLVGMLTTIPLMLSVSPDVWAGLERAAGEPTYVRDALVDRYRVTGSLVWFINITAYAALIPNTWRRCAVAAVLMAALPLAVIAVYGFWLRPIAPDITIRVLVAHAAYNGVAVAIAVFSSSRIDYYRRQASEARKLGQYVLREKLGAGGMGEVYRAEHLLLRRPCALKLVRTEKAADPTTLRRFEREVQVTATLTHPNTVQVFDYGHADDGTFYYVMEYLPGLTLDEIVRRRGPLPAGRAVHVLRQVCASLGEAHARGLTHRDIKPGNVMVCERGGVPDFVKVLDFGLVRAPKDAPGDGTLTREGTVAGTPAYMSPEQAGGEVGIDPRSDIYSVGAVAYFLLTGKPPFADRSAARMLAAHLYEAPAALPADVPAGLGAVVLRCLAKAPAARWPDATSLEAALAGAGAEGWSTHDAAAWWESVAIRAPETHAAVATATWAEPGVTADPAS